MTPEAFFLFVLLAVLAVILAVLYQRHRSQQMLHQERLAAIEKGTDVPIERTLKPWSPRVYLLRGLIWTFSGAALFICLLGLAWSSQRPEPADTLAWRAKNVSQTLDIPIEQARQIVDKDSKDHQRGVPASVALLGLIPFCVGVAYLIFFYSDPERKVGAEAAANR